MTTIRLSDRDLTRVLDAAERCGAERASALPDVQDVLDAVADLVRCDVVFWSWRRSRADIEESVLVPGRRAGATGVRPAGPGSRSRPSSLASRATQGEVGLELAHAPGETSVVVLRRVSGAGFDEQDRLVLRLLRPHVDAAIRRATRPRPAVSPREREVLRLVRDGLTNAQVARRLGVAEATVAKHLEHVCGRTGARSRTQAVTLCADLLEAPG